MNVLDPARILVRKARERILDKDESELLFRRKILEQYQRWYDGRLPELYHTPAPTPEQRLTAPNKQDAAILTWHRLHQQVKYLADLKLPVDAFDGMALLDIGAGPMPSASCFAGARLHCLDPLLPDYLRIGFPLHYYGDVKFVNGPAEAIPLDDNSMDAVISVNAIDHVNDIDKTAAEIRRVLKPGGRLRMHVHYHKAYKCEPIELNDRRFTELFGWAGQLTKLDEQPVSHSTALEGDESFALWSNF